MLGFENHHFRFRSHHASMRWQTRSTAIATNTSRMIAPIIIRCRAGSRSRSQKSSAHGCVSGRDRYWRLSPATCCRQYAGAAQIHGLVEPRPCPPPAMFEEIAASSQPETVCGSAGRTPRPPHHSRKIDGVGSQQDARRFDLSCHENGAVAPRRSTPARQAPAPPELRFGSFQLQKSYISSPEG